MADDVSQSFLSGHRLALPGDLIAVLAVVGVAVASMLVPGLRETPLRVIFGVPLVLFLPGYVFIAALFPGTGAASDQAGATQWLDNGISGIERLVLSIGLSVVIVPLLGLLIHFSPWGLVLEPVIISIVMFIFAWTAIAAARRFQRPPDERFSVPVRDWIRAARPDGDQTMGTRLLNVVLVVSVLVAVGSVGYAVAVPEQGDDFTEFYAVTENETGELVTANFSSTVPVGESEPVTLAVDNHEHEPTAYSVVVQLQRVTTGDVNSDQPVTVQEREPLDRLQTGELAADERWTETYQFTPTTAGDQLRLVFLLYPDDPPANPTLDNAYRSMYVWVTVEES
jgi:uncharacterized membrane protein